MCNGIAVTLKLLTIMTFSLLSSPDRNQAAIQKGGILCGQYPQKSEGKELKILVQPESQHRARYLTEGSRGSVKDRTQQGFPTVKVGMYCFLCNLCISEHFFIMCKTQSKSIQCIYESYTFYIAIIVQYQVNLHKELPQSVLQCKQLPFKSPILQYSPLQMTEHMSK